tara:strand:+ start:2084 stop:2998 length:915 start_codon:yes stop_codon:yes gene_type:complete
MLRFVSLFILSIICLTHLGCDGNSANKKLSVVSTTGMIHDIVLNIAGDIVQAKSLMGPGIDPHLYRASESDVLSLAKADIIFYNGLHLEAKLADVLKDMSSRSTVIAVTDSINKDKLRMPKEFEGYYDPHVWFDVRLWSLATNLVEQTLVQKDPKNKQVYQDNANRYREQLTALDAYLIQETNLVPINQRVLVTAHDAFGYFGEAYGFEVYGLQGISTQSEAAIYDVDQLANFVSMRKIPAIFVESSISKRQILAVQAAVKAKGWNVSIGGELFSDALGDPKSPAGTYIGMLKHNINTIVNGLK